MSATAPLRVPVELRRAGSGTATASGAAAPRWFRTARGISVEGLRFAVSVPDDLDGPLEVRFHLPEDPAPVTAAARVEGAERRGARFLTLEAEARLRIARYVEERLMTE